MYKAILGLLVIILYVQVYAAPPTTVKMAVTYFDYHSDGSCPDFNPVDDRDDFTPQMVANSLDADGLPTSGSRIYFSHGINKWYRDFTTHTNKDLVPTYVRNKTDEANHGSLQSTASVSYDTAYKNIVIEDSLEFTLIDADKRMYEFNSASFFPLDGKGFGNEPTKKWDNSGTVNDHNYSFAMKMEKSFTYRENSGMVFRAKGDDDVWVFIDNKLVLDIGGIHGISKDSFDLDISGPALGLVDGQQYNMALFFAERQATASNLTMTWNFVVENKVPIVEKEIEDITVDEDAPDTLIADVDTVFSDEGVLTYSVKSLDSSLVIGVLDVDNKLSLEFQEDAHGATDVIVTATDTEGLAVDDTVHVVVNSVNDDPILDKPIDDITVVEDAADTVVADLDTVFNDDGTLSYSVKSLDSTLIIGVLDSDNKLTLQFQTNAFGETDVIVTATDDDGVSVDDTIHVVVTEENDPPIITDPIDDITVVEDAADTVVADLDTIFTDDGTLNFTVKSLDSSLVIGILDTDNMLTLQFQANAYGETDVIVTATDDKGLSVDDTVHVVVTEENDIPVIKTPINDITVEEDAADTVVADLDTIFTDDGTLNFTVKSLDSSLVIGILDTDNVLTLDFQDNAFGETDVIVTATDDKGVSVDDTIHVVVTEVNDIPVVDKPIDDVSVIEDAADTIIADLDTIFTDDGTLTFTVKSLDSTLVIGILDTDNVLTLDFQDNAFGETDVIVTATDDKGVSIDDTIHVIIIEENDAPVVVTPITDVLVVEDAPDTILADLDTCITDDGTLTFTVKSLDSSLVIGTLDIDNILTLEFQDDAFGETDVIITATDDKGLTVDDTIHVVVTSQNDAPIVVKPLEDVSLLKNDPDTIIGDVDTVFSDDGPLTFVATSSDSTLCIPSLNADNMLTVSPVTGAWGECIVMIEAKDSDGLIVYDTVNVTIVNNNETPIVSIPIRDVVVNEDAPDTLIADLDYTFTDDGVLTFAAKSLNSALVLATVDSDNVLKLQFIADASGETDVIVTATDEHAVSVSDTVHVIVHPVNDMPVLVLPLPDVAVLEDAPDSIIADLDDRFSDDGTLSYTVISLDPLVAIGKISTENVLSINFIEDAIGECDLIITATDDGGLSISDTMNVTISGVNDKPVIVNPIADITVLEDAPDTIVANLATIFSDDGALSYTVASLDSSLVIGVLNVQNHLTATFLLNAFGETDLLVTATDAGGLSVTDTVHVTVVAVNDIPVITPIADVVVEEDAPDTLLADLDLITIDDGNVTFTVTSLDSSLVVGLLDGANNLILQFQDDAFGKTDLVITATDDGGLSVSETVHVIITPVNDIPIIIDGENLDDVTVDEDALDTIISDLDDIFEDDGLLTYTVVSLDSSLVIGLLDADNNLILDFIDGAFGETDVIVTATDAEMVSVSDTFHVIVIMDKFKKDDIVDFDLGHFFNPFVFDVAIVPNPIPREASKVQVALSHRNVDQIEVTVLSSLGEVVTKSNAEIVSRSSALFVWDISSYRGLLGGQTYLLHVKYFKEGVVVMEKQQLLGVRK